MFAGAVIVGFVLSITVTSCVAVAVLPAPSSTVHVTVVVPNGKVAGASLVTVTLVQLSVATGFPKFAITAAQFVLAFTVMFAGAIIVGLVLSSTITFCVAVAVFPALSVTVQVTTVVPNGKVPGALLVTEATPQLSAVVGVPKVTPKALHDEFALTVTATGAVIVGSSVSFTVTVKLAELVLPAASVAV